MNLTESERQAILRLIETGVEASAVKLGEMSRTRWSMQTLSVSASSLERLPGFFGEDSAEYCGAVFSMPGGAFLALFPERGGRKIVEAYLAGGRPGMQATREVEEQVLAEIANVLVNAVAAVLADACDIGFLLSAPEMARGEKKRLFMRAIGKFPAGGESLAIISHVHLSAPALSTDCSVFMLLNASLAGRILGALD